MQVVDRGRGSTGVYPACFLRGVSATDSPKHHVPWAPGRRLLCHFILFVFSRAWVWSLPRAWGPRQAGVVQRHHLPLYRHSLR